MAKMSAQDKKWMAQDDVRTLVAAEEIKKDKARMAAVKAESKKQQAALNNVSKSKRVTKQKTAKKRK